MRSTRPVVVRTETTWSIRSTSMSKTPFGCGIGDVFRPRAVTLSGASPQSACFGESVCRTLPTTWRYMCNVSRVSRQASYGRSGQLTRPILRQAVHRDRTGTEASRAPAVVRGKTVLGVRVGADREPRQRDDRRTERGDGESHQPGVA